MSKLRTIFYFLKSFVEKPANFGVAWSAVQFSSFLKVMLSSEERCRSAWGRHVVWHVHVLKMKNEEMKSVPWKKFHKTKKCGMSFSPTPNFSRVQQIFTDTSIHLLKFSMAFRECAMTVHLNVAAAEVHVQWFLFKQMRSRSHRNGYHLRLVSFSSQSTPVSSLLNSAPKKNKFWFKIVKLCVWVWHW